MNYILLGGMMRYKNSSRNNEYELLRCVRSCLFFTVLIWAPTVYSIDFEYSGFLRLVGGIIDDKNATYSGYDDKITFDEDSLIGLQAQLQLSDELSTTALAIARSSNSEDSGFEWLYLSYKPTDEWLIKLGKMQTPFYSLSDALDVGFAYSWTVAPREVYNDFIFRTFQGIDVRYTFPLVNYSLDVETYYGRYENEIEVNRFTLNTELKDLYGIIGNLTVDNISVRTSYHVGRYLVDLPELIQFSKALKTAGFEASAERIYPSETAGFFQISARYDSLDSFYSTEFTKISSNSDLFADISASYYTYGRIVGKFTYVLTYANRDDSLTEIGDIPNQVGLAAGYRAVFDNRAGGDTESISGAIRWDVASNIALKTEIKKIRSSNNSSDTFGDEDAALFDGRAIIYMFGLDWIF